MGPTDNLDSVEKRKISYFYLESNPSSSVVQPVVWSPYRLKNPGSAPNSINMII
jgi:hypothetical protein